MAIDELTQWLVENYDERLLWSIPGSKWCILFPSMGFWFKMIVLMGVQMIACALIAIAAHKFIVQKRGSSLSFFVGAVIIILVFCIPLFAIPLLSVTNRSLRMNLCFTPLLLSFRCLEAIFGTAPSAVESSLSNYCLYYSSIIELEFSDKDNKPVKATSAQILELLKDFLTQMIKLGLIYSIVEIHGYAPFGESESIFELRHIANNFFVAYITQLNLHMGTSGGAFVVTLLFGKKTKKVTQNAMLESTSVSDFWGRRWNQLVHGALKRGVFKPLVIRNYSKEFAAFATFIMSGLIHEYILYVLCCFDYHYPQRQDTANSNSNCMSFLGLNLAFFCYNGFLIMTEYAFIGTIMHQNILNLSLPTPLLTCMVIGTALPVAHWFTDAYVDCNIYDGLKVGCPMVAPMQN